MYDSSMRTLVGGLVITASLVCASSALGAPLGDVTSVTVPHTSEDLVSGPDGNVWFLDAANDRVVRMAPSGDVTYIEPPTSAPGLRGLAVGSDGNLWTIENAVDQLARITTDGHVSEVPLVPGIGASFTGITAGPDGNLWIGASDGTSNTFIRVSPDTLAVERIAPFPGAPPFYLTAGPGDSIYYSGSLGSSVQRLRMDGSDTALPGSTQASGIAAGPDGRLWFSELSPPGAPRIHAFDPVTNTGTSATTQSNTAAGAMTAGADGFIWYHAKPSSLARLNPSDGSTTTYSGGPSATSVNSMTPAADGSTWFLAAGPSATTSVVGRIGTGVDRVASATLSGPGVVGETEACGVTVEAPGMGSESARRYAWLRDGDPIAGATRPSYVPVAADAGHALVCRVAITFAPSLVQMGFQSTSVTPRLEASPLVTAPVISATLLPSRRRLVSGQSMRIALRITNSGGATARSVRSCIVLPSGLVVTKRTGSVLSGRAACFQVGDVATGTSLTKGIVVRTVSSRTVSRTIRGTGRLADGTVVSAAPKRVIILKRRPRTSVTG